MKSKAYMQSSEFLYEQKTQQILEKATLYNIPFLQNGVLVQSLLVSALSDEKVSLVGLNKVWKWLKQTEEKARMS